MTVLPIPFARRAAATACAAVQSTAPLFRRRGVVVQAHASGARIRRMGLGYVELQFRSPFGFSGIVIRRGAAEAPHFRSAHSPSRPDTLAQEGSSTAKAFLRALAVALHRSPTSLRWCWTGERHIAVVVS